MPLRQIRAVYDDGTITVHQAYPRQIADPAVATGRFVEPFSLTRMTWIKPSFLWMMYRCGWATKPGQERVLAIRITRDGFESALLRSCLSHFDPDLHADEDTWRRQLAASPVRIQWDPERRPDGSPLPYRSLQVGLGPTVVPAYVHDWIRSITDITDSLAGLRSGRMPPPPERPYPLPAEVARHIGVTPDEPPP